MKAMIFSAGLGTRFKPWTDNNPKALALVNGKTLLQRNIEYLQQFGIGEVIVNVHHFPDMIIDAIEKNKGWGSDVIISDERNLLLETGGGLLHARHLFNPGERFITCNVDILTNLDLFALMNFHKAENALISFGITNRTSHRNLLFDENSRLCGWRNNTTGETKLPRPSTSLLEKAYSCVVVAEYEVFDLIPFTGKFSMIDIYLSLAASHPIMGYDHSGDKFVDVGRPESVMVAEGLFD